MNDLLSLYQVLSVFLVTIALCMIIGDYFEGCIRRAIKLYKEEHIYVEQLSYDNESNNEEEIEYVIIDMTNKEAM